MRFDAINTTSSPIEHFSSGKIKLPALLSLCVCVRALVIITSVRGGEKFRRGGKSNF